MKTVLIVDDLTTERIYLNKHLQPYGVKIIEADNGQAALDMAVAHKPDLILMDVVMPGMSGFEATRKIKGHPDTKQIPIVMITTKSSKPDRINSKENGDSAYIVKPASPSDIKAIVHKFLA